MDAELRNECGSEADVEDGDEENDEYGDDFE